MKYKGDGTMQSMYNHMVGRARSISSPLYSMHLAIGPNQIHGVTSFHSDRK